MVLRETMHERLCMRDLVTSEYMYTQKHTIKATRLNSEESEYIFPPCTAQKVLRSVSHNVVV